MGFVDVVLKMSRCGFCGGEIEGEFKKFWDREGGLFIDICLKCEKEIKAL